MTENPPRRSSLRRALGAIRWSIVHDRFDVFVRRVVPADADFEAPEGLVFRFGEPADLDRCTEFHTELGPLDREHGRLRLESGHRLVLGLVQDLPVFTMWVNPRNLNVPREIKRRLDDTQVFIYKAFTSPEYRGRKLYQAGMAFVLADLARSGGEELVGYAHYAKQASRGGLARLRFESVGTYRVIGVRGLRRVLVSTELDRRFPDRVARSGVGWTGAEVS